MSKRPLVVVTDHLAEAGVERAVLDPVADLLLLQTYDEADVAHRKPGCATAVSAVFDPSSGTDSKTGRRHKQIAQ